MIKANKSKQLLNPPGWPLLAAGLVAGLVSSLLALSRSADTATAVGLAWFIGVALGGWLGLAASRGLSYGFRIICKKQIATAVAAVAAAQARLAIIQARKGFPHPAVPSGNAHSPPRGKSPIYSKPIRLLWKFSWDFLPFGLLGLFALGLVTFLFYAGGMDISIHLIGLAGGAAITFPAMLFAGLFPIALNRKILKDCRRALVALDRIERHLEAARAEPVALALPDLSMVEAAMTPPPQWLTRLAA